MIINYYDIPPSICKLPANTMLSWILCMIQFDRSTHLPLDKIATISQTTFRCIFMNGEFYILIRISLRFVLKGPIHNNTALVQIMTWCRAWIKAGAGL